MKLATKRELLVLGSTYFVKCFRQGRSFGADCCEVCVVHNYDLCLYYRHESGGLNQVPFIDTFRSYHVWSDAVAGQTSHCVACLEADSHDEAALGRVELLMVVLVGTAPLDGPLSVFAGATAAMISP